jgi:hypothetical protein
MGVDCSKQSEYHSQLITNYSDIYLNMKPCVHDASNTITKFKNVSGAVVDMFISYLYSQTCNNSHLEWTATCCKGPD